jgi:hypothetical protein
MNNEFASAPYTAGQLNAMVKLLKKQAGEDGLKRFLRGEITVTKPKEFSASLGEPVKTLRDMSNSGQLPAMYSIITLPENITSTYTHVPPVWVRRQRYLRSKQYRKDRARIILAFRGVATQKDIGRIPKLPFGFECFFRRFDA